LGTEIYQQVQRRSPGRVMQANTPKLNCNITLILLKIFLLTCYIIFLETSHQIYLNIVIEFGSYSGVWQLLL